MELMLLNVFINGLDVRWSTPTLPGRSQRDLIKLKQLATRNFRNFNKVKCKILHLGSNNPMHWCRLGTD